MSRWTIDYRAPDPEIDNRVVEPGENETDLGLERGGQVEALVFGTIDRAEIDGLIDRFCVDHLDAGVSRVLERATSVGVVTAVQLSDGRRLLLKAHQPRETRQRLQAVHDLQARLYRAGFPCPAPILGPTAIRHGHMTVEALLDLGEYRNTHDPACRQLIAEALAWHLQITAELNPPAALAGGWSLIETDRLWPVHAHAPIFDFDATRRGAEWIDELAAKAKSQIITGARLIAGHSDWSGKHFRFADDGISAVYDWDSLAVRTEATLVGVAAITFTTRFDLSGVPRAPTPEEMAAFIDEYARARRTPLQRADREQIAAWGTLLGAYTARCEHCGVDGYQAEGDPDSFTASLRAHGKSYLTV